MSVWRCSSEESRDASHGFSFSTCIDHLEHRRPHFRFANLAEPTLVAQRRRVRRPEEVSFMQARLNNYRQLLGPKWPACTPGLS